MSGTRKGLIVGAIQIALVLSLGAKLLSDRITRPRGWALAQVYDPDMPIRGRYLSERLQLPAVGFSYQPPQEYVDEWVANRRWAYLEVDEGQVRAYARGSGAGAWIYLHRNADGSLVAFTEEPVAVFISETAEIPVLKTGQELWVEVTLPTKGPPRPIRIGLKTNGVLTPVKVD
ncbi:MAG: hypothetical protein ABSA32_12975 [Candidatus Acidiferrales bacterium]|jgi:hypothetical protein